MPGVLILDVWLMNELPVLQHGVPYLLMQIGMVALVLTVLRLIFRGGSPSAKN